MLPGCSICCRINSSFFISAYLQSKSPWQSQKRGMHALLCTGPALSVMCVTWCGKGVYGDEVPIGGEEGNIQVKYTFGSHATTLPPSVSPPMFTLPTLAHNCPLVFSPDHSHLARDKSYVTSLTICGPTTRIWQACFLIPQCIAEFKSVSVSNEIVVRCHGLWLGYYWIIVPTEYICKGDIDRSGAINIFTE